MGGREWMDRDGGGSTGSGSFSTMGRTGAALRPPQMASSGPSADGLAADECTAPGGSLPQHGGAAVPP